MLRNGAAINAAGNDERAALMLVGGNGLANVSQLEEWPWLLHVHWAFVRAIAATDRSGRSLSKDLSCAEATLEHAQKEVQDW